MKHAPYLHRIASAVACAGVFVLGASIASAQPSSVSTEPSVATAASNDTPSHDSAMSLGVPPDENRIVGSDWAAPAASQTFSYYQVAGATLRGRNSTTGYVYDGSGCTHVTAGSGTGLILNTELPLPDGAIIKYLRVYYDDTNASSAVKGFLTRYQPGAGTSDLVSVGSTNAFALGHGFAVSAEITETVNNAAYAYTLIGWPGTLGATNQICGLRVAYYAPSIEPGAPTLDPPVVSGNTVGLSWTPGTGSTPTSYVLTAFASGGAVLATVPLTGTSTSFSGVPSGSYLLQLVAMNVLGSSPPSSPVPLVVP
ncbi:MAG TPA: hypothetical protein VM487_01780 [Phycisphaerae bacterium]|nr:hypothetical protein [Phycisphaerae bacterium]